jgi:hypothetical protein
VPVHRPAPTHALRGHEAWALEGPHAPLPLRREDGQLVLQAEHGVLLNGAPPAGLCVLAPGDRVAVGEREYLIIRVQD